MANRWQKMALETNLEGAREAIPRQMEHLAKDRWGFKRGFYDEMNQPQNSIRIQKIIQGDGEPLDLAERQEVEKDFLENYIWGKRRAGEHVPYPLYQEGDDWDLASNGGTSSNPDRMQYLQGEQDRSQDYLNYRLPDDFDTRYMPQVTSNRGPQSVWKRLK